MKRHFIFLALFIWGLPLVAQGQTGSPVDKVKWQSGPSTGDLARLAQINVPGGYLFAGADDTRVLMEAMQNPVSGEEIGFIAPAKLDWYVLFEFEDSGYVSDDEKDSLDADAILESIKAGTEAGNEERRRKGWPVMTILGWEQTPRYNATTHNLEWAVRAQSEGDLVINHNTRVLGRDGVMRVTLVTDPATLPVTLSKFKTILSGFGFTQGHRYAEYRQGDKLAQYGLTALVVGGATAVAVKSGLMKWLWKGLVLVFFVGAGFLKKLFSRSSS